jgi:proline iminopeptidase
MREYLWLVLCFLIFASGCGVSPDTSSASEDISLWPEIEPYESGYLRVSDIHKIHYELCGNPEGKPVFVLHGGPGGSCSPYMRRFFNPEVFLIVLHDQRGAGKSRPYGEIRENTTWELVEDIERLRQHLELGDILLFGGSWGTTLAFAYGETYPRSVRGMVLRGVFTATSEEIDHFYHGGIRTYYPDVYDEMLKALPDPDRRPLPDYFLELIQSDDPEEGDKYACLWAWYETKISAIEVPDEWLDGIGEGWNPYAFALLENYYMANDCFFEEDQLYRDAGRLSDVPVVMINGRYDAVCPPVTAYRMDKRLSKSKLIIAEAAGHWMGEPSIEQALLRAMREFE